MPSELDSLRTAVASAEAELRALEAAAQEAAERRRRAVALQVEPLADEVRGLLERKGTLEEEVRALEASPPGTQPRESGREGLGAIPALFGYCAGGLVTAMLVRWDDFEDTMRSAPQVAVMLAIACVMLVRSLVRYPP